MSSSQCIAILFADTQPETCQSAEDYTPSGLSLKVLYRPRSGQRFFSRLFSFPEETVECPADVFMNFDNTLQLQGLSMYTNMGCPWLNLGQLTFPSMTHALYFPGSMGLGLFCRDQGGLGVSNPSLAIYSTLLQSRLPLGNFMTLLPGPNSTALSVAFESDSSQFHARMHSVNVSILGTHFNVPVEIQDSNLQFSAEANLFDSYSAHLTGTAPIDTPWNRLNLSIHGEMADGENSFIQSVENYVHNFINATANRVKRKQRNAEMVVDRAHQSLDNLESEYTMREQALLLANETYEEAVNQFEVANDSLQSAQRTFETANAAIQQAQRDLNMVCNEEECGTVERCQQEAYTCYQDITVPESRTCTTLVESSRLVAVVTYGTRTEWRFLGTCGTYCRSVCFIFFSIRFCRYRCRGVCAPVPVRYPVITQEPRPVLRQETVACPSQRYNGTVSGQCSRSVCQLYPNVQCIQRCRNTQSQAIEQLQRTREEIAEPFMVLDGARSGYSIAQSTLSRASAMRSSAQQMREQIIPPYNSARTARELSQQNYEQVLSQIQRELTVAELLDEQMVPENIFRLVNVSFDVNLVTQSPLRFPLLYTFEMPATNQSFQRSVLYDFSAPMGPNLRRVAEEILNSLFNLSYTNSNLRKRSVSHSIHKRQVEISEREPNEEEFQENCADLANLREYFIELQNSLHTLNESIGLAKENISQARVRLRDQMQSDPSRYDSLINCDALESAFNTTCRDGGTADGGEEDEAVQAFNNLLEEFLQAATRLSETVDATSFVEWQSAMEQLHEQTRSVAGYPCTGFVGCLEFSVEIVKLLLEDMPRTTEVTDLLDQLPYAEEELLKLGTAMNLTIPDALEKITPIFQITGANILSTFWCSTPPNITAQPPSTVSVQSGENLVLNCSAESTVPITYQWRKDGTPIPNTGSSTLLIPNMQRADSGNYTCHASNPVATTDSLNTSVIVYELPMFYLEPSSLAVYAGNESGAFLACNATSWPYPGWRWYFRKTDSPWTVIEGEITNELLVSNPQEENEGWYSCEAYNSFASKSAQPAYLTILPVSVSQLGLQAEFEIIAATNATRPCSNISILEEAIRNFVFERVELGTAALEQLSVGVNSGGSDSYSTRFTVISMNATTENTRFSTLQEIENLALPSRGDLMNARNSLRSLVGGEEVLFSCNSLNYRVLPSTLTFQMLTYFCPPGQELHMNYLLCGKMKSEGGG